MSMFRYRNEERKNIGEAESKARQNSALEGFLAEKRADQKVLQLANTLAAFQTSTNLALTGKEPTITAGTTAQFWRGDKTWQTLDLSAVSGLASALAGKAPTVHTHSINDVTGLSSALSGLSDSAAGKVAKTGDTITGPLVMPTYLKASLPSASTYARSMIYVSDLTGGAEFCYSDGSSWRRLSDRSIAN